MPRIDDDTLSLQLEVALSTSPPSVLDGLADPDRRRRNAAIGEIVRHLVERLRCFDILSEDANGRAHNRHPSLFPENLGPMPIVVDNVDNRDMRY